MKRQAERLIQTTIHSNSQTIVMGEVSDLTAPGTINIFWLIDSGVYFVEKPIILALFPETVLIDDPPICFHRGWFKDTTDTRLYTGMKIYTGGTGTKIHWAVMGRVKK